MTNNAKMKVFKRKLPVPLTTTEKARKGEEIAKLRVEIEPFKEQRKSINEEIKVRNDSILTLSRAIESGNEERDIDCTIQVDWDTKSACTVRLDTNEEVEGTRRALTKDELQTSIFDQTAYLSEEEQRLKKAEEQIAKMKAQKAEEAAAEPKGGKKEGKKKSAKKNSRSNHQQPVK